MNSYQGHQSVPAICNKFIYILRRNHTEKITKSDCERPSIVCDGIQWIQNSPHVYTLCMPQISCAAPGIQAKPQCRWPQLVTIRSHQRFFTHKTKLMEMRFCCSSVPNQKMATKHCTCQDSIAVVTCAKFGSEQSNITWTSAIRYWR